MVTYDYLNAKEANIKDIKLTSLNKDGENVGIGTTNPNRHLDIENSSGSAVISLVSSKTAVAQFSFGDTDDDDRGRIRYDNSNDSLTFYSDAAEKMRIDSAGNIGLGENNMDAKLDVAGDIAITDGITAPSATTGKAKLFVDTADGDLKVIFGDGTTKTIASNP